MGVVSAWAGRRDRPARRARGHDAGTVHRLGSACTRSRGCSTEGAYLAVWAFLGVGMRLCLYDAAFAALVQVVPSRGRLAISYLTLFGAFASTVFWVSATTSTRPAAGGRRWCCSRRSIWPSACRSTGSGSREREAAGAAPDGAPAAAAAGRSRRSRDAGVPWRCVSSRSSCRSTVSCSASCRCSSCRCWRRRASPTAAAVWVASLKGFAQFGGRVVEIVFGRNLRAITVARIAIGVLPAAFAAAARSPAGLSGHRRVHAADGRLAGRHHHRARRGAARAVRRERATAPCSGVIATPVLVVNAASPTLFALIVDRWGWHAAQVVLIAASAASCGAMELMSRWYERSR